MHFENSNFKHKMERLQILQNLVHEKVYVRKKNYVHQINAVSLSKMYFLNNATKERKPKQPPFKLQLKKITLIPALFHKN